MACRLVLLVFSSEARARHAFDEVRRAPGQESDDLLSCCEVGVGADGAVTVTTTDSPGSGDPFWGMFWEALFGLVFLVPTAGTSYGATVGGLFGAIERAGVGEEARTRIRASLGPRTTGLALLLRDGVSERLVGLEETFDGARHEFPLELDERSELAQELGAITR